MLFSAAGVDITLATEPFHPLRSIKNKANHGPAAPSGRRGQPSDLPPLWSQQSDAHNAEHEEREDLNAGWKSQRLE